LKNGGGDAVAVRRKNEERREAVKEKNRGSKTFFLLYKRGVTKGLSQGISD
jgi:hypothetical protein